MLLIFVYNIYPGLFYKILNSKKKIYIIYGLEKVVLGGGESEEFVTFYRNLQ